VGALGWGLETGKTNLDASYWVPNAGISREMAPIFKNTPQSRMSRVW